MSSNKSVKKLEKYLESISKGFFLLTVNDICMQNGLMELISGIKPSYIAFDMKNCSFRESLNYLKSPSKADAVLYYNFDQPKEELDTLLEKFNLARDLLLQQDVLLIFVVPLYVRDIIQTDFPDLYSYFLYKEEYIVEHANFLSYILPWSRYLNTKEIQHAFKKHFFSSKKTLDEKLNYFHTANASLQECKELAAEIKQTIDKLQQNGDSQKYVYSLVNSYAEVLLIQGVYRDAYLQYMELNQVLQKQKERMLYFQTLMGMGDVHFAQKEYPAALVIYSNTIAELNDSMEYPFENEAELFLIQLYARNALCYALQDDYLQANNFMNAIDRRIHDKELLEDPGCFSLYYNYFLILLNQKSKDNYAVVKVLNTLNEIQKNEVQAVMYTTLYSWYKGVIQGNIEEAMPIALESLTAKRMTLIENDERIAESHYVISTIYMMTGNMEKAKYCCEKAKNILTNYDRNDDLQWNLIQTLEEQLSIEK